MTNISTPTAITPALIDALVQLAHSAGDAILSVYAGGADVAKVQHKSDDSPLTEADRLSHTVIMAGLRSLTPTVSIVSEEGSDAERTMAALPDECWMVDPLDGTKEFVKRTGEFTVNIALMRSGRPVLGVVYAPVLGTTWIGDGTRAERRAGAERTRISVKSHADVNALRIVASRDHAGPLVKALLEGFPGAETLSMGSSLKFCLVAEGRADLYLRDGPTMAWDTAAAQAVLESAGGAVVTLEGEPLRCYAPSERNPFFVAVGSSEIPWQQFIETQRNASE